ncbi:MAG: LacI family DNA-binding transcriptional regulator [Gammaproteobacteria bacterium]|nr:LacI family DNA-binding transcriptional regulator [Gammaproteobacteria bacterium]MBU1440244.1 LacI family DNA-binding transcriptional regulator [Gammaproteobacteria bacterium]MBU2288521.1 LacI family DNA-binding transcriptional regulator [Gammaproteobacteria bacterium]MBU2407758.1 LacI family DNA-binding transcriptional regulator [Gammaproteobacteria bacterium]
MAEGRVRSRGQGARMRDVANAAGVSLMTVSRALREPQRLSEETRKAVLDAVKKIGYVPNSIAANLASNRSSVVGQIVPSIQNSLYADTVKGSADVLRTAGMHLLLADSGYSLQEEEALIGAFLAQRVCGLILHNTDHTPRALQMIERAGVPVIETGDVPRNPIDMAVSYSNAEAAKAMTLHLAARGYRRIAFVSLDTKINRRARERQRGYLAALKSLGRKSDPLLMAEVGPGLTSGAHAMVDMLARAPDIDAIFFAGDVLAIGALFESQRRGWKVPGRVAIAGFDDLDILQHTVPRLTCLRLPRLEIGRRSAEALLDRVRGRGEQVRLDLGFEVIQREST